MEFHPIANLFPLMEGKPFEELCEDIRANGLREPIVLYEGQVLDGRNRWRGCEATGTEPETIEFEGSDPLAYAISLNLRRRHLDESQRAMVAARIANLKNGQRASPIGEGAVTQQQAADMLNVAKRTVERAAKVQRAAPDLAAAVDAGEVSVSAAATVVDAREEYPFTANPHWSPAAAVQAKKALDGLGQEEKRAVLALVEEAGSDVPLAVAIAQRVAQSAPSEVKAFVEKFNSQDEKDRQDAARWAASQPRLCDPLLAPCLKLVQDATAALKRYPGRPEEFFIQRGIAQFERAIDSLKERHKEERHGAIDD